LADVVKVLLYDVITSSTSSAIFYKNLLESTLNKRELLLFSSRKNTYLLRCLVFNFSFLIFNFVLTPNPRYHLPVSQFRLINQAKLIILASKITSSDIRILFARIRLRTIPRLLLIRGVTRLEGFQTARIFDEVKGALAGGKVEAGPRTEK
ncbi:MAG: hypothetical protein AAB662_03860, partial [Patescibacteria group bacterium]